ncbi:MAG: right-handed parallel beta-helix repeat-containing protein [Candidatus Wildermuthbacteria bacterium]|nr:right-handed parallel beta-helix repeat-containing protein [Candidatus Wildermuthbacteria bacterium]
MNFKIGIIVICAVLFAIAGFLSIKFFSTTKTENAEISGMYLGNQIWSGEIIITGDAEIFGKLTVLPGTVVKFAVDDDRGRGDEVEKDGFNDNDPTRLKSYTTTHSGIFVFRKLIAKGEKDKQIIFTSAAKTPNLADWESIVFMGDGSIVENVIVEYSRNGLNPAGKQQNSIIKNSIVRHTLWGAISASHSSIQIVDNYLSDAGHEGIDLAYEGEQIVRGNTIEDCHTGIAVIDGSAVIENNTIRNCGDGILVSPNSSPKLSGNMVILAPDSSKREWRYGDYVIPIFDYP